ncbi:hypothetical protein CRG98_029125 [Punica granatum]|uniref:Uncharacterized protein n=1 Tax=Punica granatum TaxID=22663 RepID=A0A2I0J2L7_PUNGR|nr:hypothetical protein CRG98_029125 [Punica granatum]
MDDKSGVTIRERLDFFISVSSRRTPLPPLPSPTPSPRVSAQQSSEQRKRGGWRRRNREGVITAAEPRGRGGEESDGSSGRGFCRERVAD